MSSTEQTENDRIYREGMAAKRLLEGGDFAFFLNKVSAEQQHALVYTPVGAQYTDQRDNHHRMISCLREIAALVVSTAAELDALEADQAATEEDYE